MTHTPGTTTAAAPHELNTFRRNPRRGDVKAIAASLRVHGQYRPIVANIGTHTGRPNEVLAGNHTLMAFRDLAESDPERFGSVLVHWVDVDDDRALRIVLADNRTAELGGMDSDTLYGLLNDVGTLEGTGYDREFLDMLAELDSGPPELEQRAGRETDSADDGLAKVKLKITWDTTRRWREHRKNYLDDSTALAALFAKADAP